MDQPLETSRTAVYEQEEAADYFGSRPEHARAYIGHNMELDDIQRIHSSLQVSSKSKHEDDNLSINSLETIGNDANDDRDNIMYAADANLYFPEGGKQAYLVLFGSFMALTFSFGMFNSLGVIETYISENQLADTPHSTVSWIFSIMLFVNFLTLVFSGVYFDRNGSRTLLILGWLLTVGGMLGTGNATKVWHFILSFSVLVGVGGGLIVSPAFGCVAQYFSRKRGFMTSVASTGGSIGGIIFPLMLRKLYVQVGFAWSMRVCALFATVCYIIAFIFLKERFEKQKTEGTKIKKALSYTVAVDFKGLRDFEYLFVVIGCMLGECSALITVTYLASYARAQGQTMSTSLLLLSVSQACGIPGRWITGLLSDKFGRFNVMIITLFISGIIPFVILLPSYSTLPALYAFSAFWGFFTGSIFSLLPVCCGQISKTEEFGRRYGTMYSIVAFGTLAAIPIAGAILGDGRPSDYKNCLVYLAGSIMFGSCACYVVSRYFCVGKSFFVKF